MRLVVARCTVDYDGRLTAHLPEAVRLIMVKADGCVAIHADGGAYKPLNWMNAPNRLSIDDSPEADGVVSIWRVANSKGEVLTITVTELLSDDSYELGQDPGLQKDGVEAHLQELLAANPGVIAEGLRLVRREYPTDIGPVDLLCKDASGVTVAVEIKRRGEIDGVEQLTRYLDFLNRDPLLRPVKGVFVAQEIKPQAKVLATDRSIGWVEVDYAELRGIESSELRLF
jgi:RecB family endonuclease NucS